MKTKEMSVQIDESLLDEIIILVTDINFEYFINSFLDALFQDKKNVVLESGEQNIAIEKDNRLKNGKGFLNLLLRKLPRPYTIVQEPFHIDRSYRDTYYMYFSNQHFDVKRYSRRLSFFVGEMTLIDFLGKKQGIEEVFIGSCVINPPSGGLIGRTLINPGYIIDAADMPVYLRTSMYKLNILGVPFEIRAFPYRMQDQETMCCAEVTLLNILEHYSNSYEDYKSVNPSDIINYEQKHSHERVLPSKGMTYPILTKVMSEFGFSPRLYNLHAIRNFNYSRITQKDELRRWLHYYIESGFPVALNLNPIGAYGTGHSVVCIGHGKAKEELKIKAKQNKLVLWSKKENCHPIINSADFYEDYVITDDNQFLYQIRKFDNISIHPDMQVVNLAVPLYKRMFLDAPDAADIIIPILQHDEYGISAWCNDFLQPREDVIVRIFMASSRSFKKYRLAMLKDLNAKIVYSLLRLPRFIWICELYRESDYDNLEAFGEIVIDATSASNRGHKSLLMMHYPNVIACRYPETTTPGFEKQIELPKAELFKGYRSNLMEIKSEY